MDYLEFKKVFKEECERNNIKEDNIETFYKYMKTLLEWNEKINVTAIKDEKEFIVKHFVDSLTISELVDSNKKIIDIGTGAGFPGIPLKIHDDSLNVTLVDSVNKKVTVLNSVIEELKLNSIEALHTRAEDLANQIDYRECFDYAVSRAVANMTTLVEYLLPFVKVGGKVICMKGPNYSEELESSRKAIEVLGGQIESVMQFNISSELERNVVIINKVKNTPKKYPRGQGKPLRMPIV